MKKNILFLFLFFIPLGVFAQNPQSKQQGSFCDPNFVGEPINFMQYAELNLDELLSQIHSRYGVNFMIGPDVGKLPINIKSNNIPWNTLLSSQLYLLGVRPTCINGNTIQLVKNESVPTLEKGRLNSIELRTETIKLRYLQPTTTGNRDISGQRTNQGGGGSGQCAGNGGNGGNSGNSGGSNSQNCGPFEQLKHEIEKILGIDRTQTSITPSAVTETSEGTRVTYSDAKTTADPNFGSVSQVPGRNILIVRGTADQLAQIRQMIALADRPPFQVIIKGLVYTANENRLRDFGAQTSITVQTGVDRGVNGDSTQLITGLGNIFDFSAIIGTTAFSIQASALAQNGIISIKSRPFAIVLDGDATSLEVGRQIPVLTQGSVIGTSAGNLEFIGASNLLSVTPHVIDDENGNPVAVNLELQIESNEVDTSVISQDLPAITRRSIQSRLILNQDKTVILGGFTVDSNNNTVSKTPGLGDIPILGYLFKRKIRSEQINRLYFALSVSVVPYGSVIEPVVVPGATTDVPSITPEMLKRAKTAPTVVTPPIKDK